MKTIKTPSLTWIYIYKPKKKDIEYLGKNFNFHPLILEELLSPTLLPKLEKFKDYFFLVLHFPLFRRRKRETYPGEIDFLITKNTIVTIGYQPLEPLDAFFQQCNLRDKLREQYLQNSGLLLYHILEKLIDACFPQLTHIEENIRKVEKQIWRGKEKEMVKEISIVKRDILDYSRIILPQKTVLDSLVLKGAKFFGKSIRPYFSEMNGDYSRISTTLENFKETIEALESTNQSLLSNRISEIIKILTVISFITFPLGVIAGIFGMNVFRNHPFIENPSTFWIIIGAMVISTIAMIVFFKKKRWL